MVSLLRRERPKVVIKADLLPAVTVLSMTGLLGIPVGWVWSRLAPPQTSQISSSGTPVPTGEMETYHSFDALAVFALLLLVSGVVIGVLVWLMRERRGPVVMIAGAGGAGLAAWLAMLMGKAFTASKYRITGKPGIGDFLQVAPEIKSAWVLVVAPLAVALTYLILAAANGRDDLGRRLG